MGYPTRKSGDQYYPRGFKTFLKNEAGDEIYARDRQGKEFYPSKPKRLAKNRYGKEYYARDRQGNDVYPVRRNRSVLRRVESGDWVPAKTYQGGQIYPHDRRGNEYYVTDKGGGPVLMTDEKGKIYYAKNRAGRQMIPEQIYLNSERDVEQWHKTRDVAKNIVYVKGDKNNASGIWKCACELMWLCPVVLGIYYTLISIP